MLKNNKKNIIIISIVFPCLLLFAFLLIFKNDNITLDYNDNNPSKKINFKLENDKKYIKDIIINNKNDKKQTIDLCIKDTNLSKINGNIVYYLMDINDNLIDKGLVHPNDKTTLATIDIKNNQTQKYKLKLYYHNIDSKININLLGELMISKHKDEQFSKLDYGYRLNEKMIAMANANERVKVDNNIKTIKISKKIKPEYTQENNIISTKDSSKPIYMWYESNTIYFYSENKIKFNTISNSLFSNLESLVNIEDLKYIDASDVKDLSYFFNGDKNLSNIKSISYFKTSSLENMNGMFQRCEMLSDITPIAAFDTSKVRSMASLLAKSGVSNVDALKYFDTAKLEDIGSMFENTDLSSSKISALVNWNTENIKDMSFTFSSTRLKDLTPLKNWNTKSLESLLYSFSDTGIKNVNALSNWDVSNVTNMDSIFRTCISLEDIEGLKKWNTKSLEKISYAFANTQIEKINALKNWNTDKLNEIEGMLFESRKVNNIAPLTDWNVSNVTSLKDLFNKNNITNINAIKNWNVSNVTNLKGFLEHTKIESVDALSNWDVSNVTDFSHSFNGTKLSTLKGLEKWSTSKGNNFSYMFSNTNNLKDASAISDWNISNGNNFEKMFYKSSSTKPTFAKGHFDQYGTFVK